MSDAMPSRRPTPIPGCAWLKRASSPGTSRPPAGRSAPDPDPSAQHTAKLVHLGVRGFHFGEHTATARGERLSGLRRAHAAAGAVEQRGAELLFEPSDWCESADCAMWSSSAARVK
jgi:hypothetical protein